MIPYFGNLTLSKERDTLGKDDLSQIAFDTPVIVEEWDISIPPPEDIGKPILVDETEYSNRLVRTYTYDSVLENKVFLSIGYYKKSKYAMPPEVVWNVTKYIHHKTFTDSFRNRQREMSKLQKEFDNIWEMTRKRTGFYSRPETPLSNWSNDLQTIFVNAGIMPSSAKLIVIDPGWNNTQEYKEFTESKILLENKGRLNNFVLLHIPAYHREGRPNVFRLYFPHVETTVQGLGYYDFSIKVPDNLFPDQPLNIMNGMTFQQLKDAGFQIG
jgi:hypothetical protein